VAQRFLIFDIGCHNGQDSDFYLKKGFTVVAVEANPNLCAELRRRFAEQMAEGRFILIDRAIAERPGEVEFYVNDQKSTWGTIKPGFAKKAAAAGTTSTEIVVPSLTFSTLIEKFGVPYYMKVDIEGVDLLCIEGLLQFDQRPKFLSFERSLSLRQQIDELRLLRNLGYARFQIVDQQSIPSQVPPRPAREGAYVDHSFELDATGLFGAELPSPWLTFGGAIRRCAMIFARNKRIGLFRRIPGLRRLAGRGSWYDLHAALPASLAGN
jgi:FkbM family methyltransferase